MKTSAIAIVLACAIGLPGADRPRFEVATLKQSPPLQGNSISINLGGIKGDRFYMTNVALNDCVKFACGLASDEQVTLITQTLLADRLKVVIHRGQRDIECLALVPGKDGPKIPPADASQELYASFGIGHMTGNRATMGLLAKPISRMEHQIVVVRTGLSGEYQIKLLWAPGSAGADVTPIQDSAAPSIFAAVQEQLGLKLESRKGRLDVVAADHADKVPTEN